MYSIVTLARRAGKRRRDRELANDQGLKGELQSSHSHSVLVVELKAIGRKDLLLPPLYEPRLVCVFPRGIRLLGYECLPSSPDDEGKGPAVVQEWIIEFEAPYPEDYWVEMENMRLAQQEPDKR